MTQTFTLLLLEDEPLIMLDLEYAAEDRGCIVLSCASCDDALVHIEAGTQIDAAVLDVSLGDGQTCFPVAQKLAQLKIPYILHSGDLDRHNERIRDIDAQLVAKPASAESVISHAIAHAKGRDNGNKQIAAE
ncbi:MAG: response regulator [Pseudomonadota bacterium]